MREAKYGGYLSFTVLLWLTVKHSNRQIAPIFCLFDLREKRIDSLDHVSLLHCSAKDRYIQLMMNIYTCRFLYMSRSLLILFLSLPNCKDSSSHIQWYAVRFHKSTAGARITSMQCWDIWITEDPLASREDCLCVSYIGNFAGYHFSFWTSMRRSNTHSWLSSIREVTGDELSLACRPRLFNHPTA